METSSDLAWCYQVLELPSNATQQEIKMAYRHLARQYHPDLNVGDRQAEDRFKQIALAYQTLLTAFKQVPQTTTTKSYAASSQPATPTTPSSTASSRVRFYVKHPEPNLEQHSTLSADEKLLKLSTLNQIYSLLKHKNWQKAINVAEKLTNQFPGDPDTEQWLAVAYHRWARTLIEQRQYEQARIYLQKAIQTDPHNRQLWLAIDRDYKNIERRLRL